MKRTEGRLVTSDADTRLFLVKGNRRFWVTSGGVMQNLGFDWADITKIENTALAKLPLGEPISAATQKCFETDRYVCCIERTWSDDFATGITGWVVGKGKPIKKLSIGLKGEKAKPVVEWINRSDIYEYYKQQDGFRPTQKNGFAVLLPKTREHVLTLGVDAKPKLEEVSYSTSLRHQERDLNTDRNLEDQFRKVVNDHKLSVLEVGSRISPGGYNKREYFKNASKYVGFDYIDGETVDVVGDAHNLSKYFKKGSFDALYSDCVFEHLAMPWKAVAEMNKVLKIGGYAFHSAPSTWPLHDLPWDFWRFSHAGLQVLFSKPFGFEVIDYEYSCPSNIHINLDIDDSLASHPLSPAFGFVKILAKKTAHINTRKVRFNYDLQQVVGDSSYPEWHD
jgi:SAM-dependent methyltransferase